METINKTIFGMRVNVVPDAILPKVQTIRLSDDVCVSGEFRSEMNQWLFDMFGEKSQVIMTADMIAMTGDMLRTIEKQMGDSLYRGVRAEMTRISIPKMHLPDFEPYKNKVDWIKLYGVEVRPIINPNFEC